MNILIVVPWYKPRIGGVIIAVEKVVKALAMMGENVFVLTRGENDKITQIWDDNGVPVYALNKRFFYSKQKSVKAFIACLVYLIPTIIKLKAFIKKNNIDKIVINYPMANDFYFVILKKLLSYNYFIFVHGSDINLLPELNRISRFAVVSLIKNALALATCSRRLMGQAEANIKKLPKIKKVIYTGIDPDWVNKKPEKNFDVPGKYILTLAWATPVKGPDIILKAFALLKDKYPDVHLVMIGSGPREIEIRNLIENLNLANRVKRMGTLNHDHIQNIFRNALFGVIPSRNEGFGQVALEYQIFKKAVIATNVGGLTESLTDDFNALLIPPDDVNALAEKMDYLLENPDKCRELGENGYRRVSSDFTIDKTGKDVIKLLTDSG